jgi:hypothetical protein
LIRLSSLPSDHTCLDPEIGMVNNAQFYDGTTGTWIWKKGRSSYNPKMKFATQRLIPALINIREELNIYV